MIRSRLVVALSVVALLGCGEPPPPEPPPDPADGVDPAVPAGPGEARAGRVRPGPGTAALFGGIAAEGQAGDFKIYNQHVQFIIQDAYHSHGYVDTGGLVIDADLVRAEDMLHRDPFDDFFLSQGIGWLFHANDVSVVADGSEGAAIVRATGGFEMWNFIHGAIEATDPFLPEAPVAIRVDYRLEPDSHTLEIEAEFSNSSGEIVLFNPSFGYLGSGEDLVPWVAGLGLNPLGFDEADALGAVDRWGGATYSIWKEDGPIAVMGLQDLISQVGLSGTSDGLTELEDGQSVSLRRNLTVTPDTLSAEAIRRAGQEAGTVSGTVRGSNGGLGIAGARVHFVAAESSEPDSAPEIAGFSRTDAKGSWSASLPPGSWRAYVTGRGLGEWVDVPEGAGRYAPFANEGLNQRQLAILTDAETATAPPMARGHLTPEPTAFELESGGQVSLDLQLDEPGSLHIVAVDDDGSPTPAYAEVRWASGSGPQGDHLEGLHAALDIPQNGSLYARLWSGDGELTLPAPPGTYSVHVSYSWRHERADVSDVVVESGSAATVEVVLEEVVGADGWLAMDSHLHAAPSNDGSLGMEDRLLACAAVGVQLPVTTDHDRMADYRPLATALGLDDRLQVIPGVEVSPVIRGHFNLFPIAPNPSGLVNGGAPAWWEIPEDTNSLMAMIREAGTSDSMVQVNHGRNGMFDFGGYNPVTGSSNADTFSWDFDLFELMNTANVAAREELKADYFSFLNQGQLKVPTGVSDSHSRTSPCGLGRTDVFLGSQAPREVTATQLREALLGGHVVVTSGPTLRVTSGKAIPGDVLVGGEHVLSVQVSGPSYIQPDEVRLIRNGVVVANSVVDPSAYEGGVWVDTSFPIDESEDAWFVVEVEGSTALGHVWRGAVPYAITGAFLVDVAGDGWEAPGL